jgi:Macrocin-O-methyltransferase (TylF)
MHGSSEQSAESAIRAKYIDLAIKILVNSIYEDPAMDPWSAKNYDKDVRAVGKDWPRTAHTMVGLARLRNLRDLVERTLREQVPGDYIETGVWRGGCCILMRAILAAYGDTRRKVYVADSFEGLPPPKPEKFRADVNDKHHTFEELAVTESQVRENFAKYDLLDDQVVFLKGFFETTLPAITVRPFALLRLDGDMYGSTIVALENLYPRLSPNGYIIIDDYGAVEGCRMAVEEYRSKNRISAPIQTVDWTGVWWQKPADSQTFS